jgi:hypothetical protein
MSLSALGNKNGLGHKMSEFQRAKLVGNKHAAGHRWSDEEKRRIGQSMIGNRYAVKNKED